MDTSYQWEKGCLPNRYLNQINVSHSKFHWYQWMPYVKWINKFTFPYKTMVLSTICSLNNGYTVRTLITTMRQLLQTHAQYTRPSLLSPATHTLHARCSSEASHLASTFSTSFWGFMELLSWMDGPARHRQGSDIILLPRFVSFHMQFLLVLT